MAEIKTTKTNNLLVCLDNKCVFQSECAIHKTASSFRAKNGFKPRILFLDDRINCTTKNQDSVADTDSDMAFGKNFNLPKDYMKLGKGQIQC